MARKRGAAGKRDRDEDDDEDEGVRTKRGGRAPAAAAAVAVVGGANKGKAAAATAASSSSSSSSSSSRGGAAAAQEKNRAHYPEIPFSFSAPGKLLSKSHTEILIHVVTEICKVEAAGLEKFFKANPGAGRDAVLATLKEVLSALPGEVQSKCPEDAQFSPEFVGGEKSEVEVLMTVLGTLREQSATLERYEQSIEDFGQDYGIWVSSEQAKKKAPRGGNRRGSTADEVEAKAKEYDKLLSSMELQCAAVLKDAEKVRAVVDEATKEQDKLYHAINVARIEGATTVSANSNPKDLIKGLAKKG